MDYKTFLSRAIDNGIEGVRADYVSEHHKEHLEGSIAGFEACRNLLPSELIQLLRTANRYVEDAFINRLENYWFFKCYHGEVEWVLNVISAMLMIDGQQPLLHHLPTARGMLAAYAILGAPPGPACNRVAMT